MKLNRKWKLMVLMSMMASLMALGYICLEEEPKMYNGYYLYCDEEDVDDHCLCYTDPDDNQTVAEEEELIVSSHDRRPVGNGSRCAVTFSESGRLGNNMGQYAALYALSRLNRRPAFMSPGMARVLTRYFKVTMPSMNESLFDRLSWSETWLNDWMSEEYGHLKGQLVRLVGYPCSFTFYHHLRQDIRTEFTLREEFEVQAQRTLNHLRSLRGAGGGGSSATFVGVHVRRGDYVNLMENNYRGVLAGREFFVQATAIFRLRYPDAMFVVVSDDMEWCKNNIPNDRNDVHFVGNDDSEVPIADLALLVNCNHTIFTIGTFGHWAAYLSGGDVVYLTNFTMPDSVFLNVFKYEAAFPPEWIPIAADLSRWTNQLSTTTKSQDPTTGPSTTLENQN